MRIDKSVGKLERTMYINAFSALLHKDFDWFNFPATLELLRGPLKIARPSGWTVLTL